jgi:hypothetical protein
VLYTATVHAARAATATTLTLIQQAFRRHIEKSGCSGDPPERTREALTETGEPGSALAAQLKKIGA